MPVKQEKLRVGVIDSIVPSTMPSVCAIADFSAANSDECVDGLPLHGQSVIDIIHQGSARIEICIACVFGNKLVCSARQVAEAIYWLCNQQVRIINMSFGLLEDRSMLRQACSFALDQGICLIAATPARGRSCFPARYPGVLRATGDARCKPSEISYLDSIQADFGGYPGNFRSGITGASCGCASITAAIAQLIVAKPDLNLIQIRDKLIHKANYRGTEKRSDTSPPIKVVRS